jgi:hypothetical protein
LRALPRFAEFPFRSFPRFCTFDPFFRLAMIRPGSGWWSATHDVGLKSHGNALNDLSTDRSLSAAYQALFFPGRTERSLFFERKVEEGEVAASLHCPVRQTNACRPRKRHDGDEGKAVRRWERRRLCCLSRASRRANRGDKEHPR